MALGTPVVATAVGGVPEVIQDRVTGLLVPPGDDRALADACLELARDRDWARRLGAQGRRLVEEEFSHLAERPSGAGGVPQRGAHPPCRLPAAWVAGGASFPIADAADRHGLTGPRRALGPATRGRGAAAVTRPPQHRH